MKSIKALKRYSKPVVRIGAILVVLFVLAILSSGATGSKHESPDDTADQVGMAAFGIRGTAMKVIGSILLVLGILYASVYAMKAFSGRASGGHFRQDAIAVLYRRYIAPKKAIYVVKVANRPMVLGVTDSQISHLADLSEEDIEGIKATESRKTKDFKSHLLGFALGVKAKE